MMIRAMHDGEGPLALLLGGTGAIGVYVTKYLQERGYRIDITTRSERTTESDAVSYLQGDAKNMEFLRSVVETTHYDAIVDFMVWSTSEFTERYRYLEEHTDQYVFLSSYRVFAESPVIDEDSPRLLDVCKDEEYLRTDEYALAKARQEDLLRKSGRDNYTIIRPSITYSTARFQLGTLECEQWLWRILQGKTVPLAAEMLDKQATLTWAGDAGRFIASLIGKNEAMGHAFNVVTDEHHTWRDIVSIYADILPMPLRIKPVGLQQYIQAIGLPYQYQVRYDRMLNRVMDNRRVLAATGIDKESVTTLADGLANELHAFLVKPNFRRIDPGYQGRADRLTGEFTWPFRFGLRGSIRYIGNRLPAALQRLLRGR